MEREASRENERKEARENAPEQPSRMGSTFPRTHCIQEPSELRAKRH